MYHCIYIILLSFIHFTHANTEVWKLNTVSDTDINIPNDEKLIHHLSPLQINNVLIDNIPTTDNNQFWFTVPKSNDNSVYIKLSWSAIDPIQSFTISPQLYSIPNNNNDTTIAFSLTVTPSHTINLPLSINIYIDNTMSLLTHDLHSIVFYIIAVVSLLSIIYIKYGGINSLLLHNITL